MRKVIIMGAGGRDFHDFNVVFRNNPDYEVVAFTAAQIPGIDDRKLPGRRSPARCIRTASRSTRRSELVAAHREATASTKSCSPTRDLSHEDVMHKASTVLAAGATSGCSARRRRCCEARKPVIAVCAVRTGCGKSQTSRKVGQILLDAGLKVALVRHPMPYGDLEAMRVQRFATLEDIDASHPTIEEREEYEAPVRMGMVMYAGVDYEAILREAEEEADVIIWDGGNNDFPFFEPDVFIIVVDPLRPGHELRYHPGETNLRMADVVVVNKVDSAAIGAVGEVIAEHRGGQPAGNGRHGGFAGRPGRRALDRRRPRPGRRRRADADTRRHAVRCGHGCGPTGWRAGARRPASVRGWHDQGRPARGIPSGLATGDGLLARPAPRARDDDQRFDL